MRYQRSFVCVVSGLTAAYLSACASHSRTPDDPATTAQDHRNRLWCEPYLQNPRRDAMTVLWWTTDSQPDSVVEYGTEERDRRAAASDDLEPSMGLWRHEVTLADLEPGTSYDYVARSGDASSAVYSFRTAPERDAPLHIAFLGDGRTDDDAVIARHRELMLMAGEADLVFELGDNVDTGTEGDWASLLRRIVTASDPDQPGADTGSRVPVQFVVGNHEIALLPEGQAVASSDADYYGRPFTSMERFEAIAANPPNGATDERWHERYYSIDYGCVTLIVLDSNNTSDDAYDNHDFLRDGDTPDWEPGSEQYEWMLAELERARRESVFTFVLCHPSPYSPGVHGSPAAFIDGERVDTQRGHELRVLDPLFREHGVDAVITSHDHLTARALAGPAGFEAEMSAEDPRNINYFVVGNSGNSSREAHELSNHWMSIHGDGGPPYYTQWFYPWAGDDERCSFLDASIARENETTWSVTFQIVRDDGQTFDPVTIRRADPLAADGR